MIALTESRKLELIEECKKVMDESSPDGDIYPIYAIALESLTAVPTYSRYRLSAKGSGPDAEKSPWFAGDGKALRESHDVEVGNLFTAPPVPEIKFPDTDIFNALAGEMMEKSLNTNGKAAKAYSESAHRIAMKAKEFRDEIKRLNGLGE